MPERRGPRVVAGLYLLIVSVTAVGGYSIGVFVDDLERPAYLFLVEFPATSLGFAAYGALTIATALGVPLLAVIFVSRRIEDPDAVDGD